MANEKILVVDDDVNICELLRLYLEKEGYTVSIVNDGESAVKSFGEIQPDLMLLDIMLPRLDSSVRTTMSSNPSMQRKLWRASRQSSDAARAPRQRI